MPTIMQTAFNCGEWTKFLNGRVDLEKRARAVRTLENMILDPRGPAMFRPGFRYIAGAKYNDKKCRLISFDFGADQSYQLEFGDQYIRFYTAGAQIKVAGNAYEVSSPYLEDDLDTIDFFQSYDVLYLFHPSYEPRKLSRVSNTSWTLGVINFRPPPVNEQGHELNAALTLSAVTGTGITVTAGSGIFLTGDIGRIISSGVGRCSITSFNTTSEVIADVIDDFTGVNIASGAWLLEGSPNGKLQPTVKGPVGSICTLTSTGTSETFTNLIGAGTDWEVSAGGTNEYYLSNTALFYPASKPSRVYENGVMTVEGILGSLGVSQWGWGDNDALGYNTVYVRLVDGTDPDGKTPLSYLKYSSILAASELFRTEDADKYIRIYGGMIHITAIISSTQVSGEILKILTSVEDDAVSIDPTEAWTLESASWGATNGYPACGTFHAERLIVGGSPEYPDTLWGSVVGDYENFTPGVDDSDSFTFALGARKANIIRWLESEKFLLVGTLEKIWKVGTGNNNEPITPLNISVEMQNATRGSEPIMPVLADQSILYVQRHGRKVRELAWSWETERYISPDMTLLAEHVTKGIIGGMAYQEEPYSIIWGWLQDGSLISLTYLRDQDVVGWARHPMDNGYVESLSCNPGDGYTEVWAAIRRVVNGQTVRYIEQLAELFDDDAATFTANKGLNAFFVDSGITYNGGAATTITGLTHLEGEAVNVLADGALVTGKTVASGQITLSTAASVVHVGLPVTAKLEPLGADASLSNGTAQTRQKKIHKIHVRVCNSGPFKAGRDEDNLDVVRDREAIPVMGDPYQLFSGDLKLGFDDNWNTDGYCTIIQDKPFPLTVSALIYDVDMK